MGEREVLESDALRAFAVFAEHANFTTAAARLHISQPSLHAKITKLGRTLGQTLYEREGRGLVLTPAGHRLATLARDTSARVEEYLAERDAANAPITLAAGRGALRWVVSDGVRRVAAVRQLNLAVVEGPAATQTVLDGRADLAVLAYDPPPRSLRSRLLARYPQTLVVPADHALAGRAPGGRATVRLADLAGLALVVPPADRPHRRALERALAEAGTPWRVATEVDGWDLMTHFVALGLGVAVVNGCVLPPAGLAVLPVTDLPAVRYWAAWRPSRGESLDDVVETLAGSVAVGAA